MEKFHCICRLLSAPLGYKFLEKEFLGNRIKFPLLCTCHYNLRKATTLVYLTVYICRNHFANEHNFCLPYFHYWTLTYSKILVPWFLKMRFIFSWFCFNFINCIYYLILKIIFTNKTIYNKYSSFLKRKHLYEIKCHCM